MIGQSVTANEFGVQFIVWLLLALLFVVVGFLLYQIGMAGIIVRVIYCAIAISVSIFRNGMGETV